MTLVFADILVVLAVGCIAIVVLLAWGCRRAVEDHTPEPLCSCANCIGAALAMVERDTEVRK